MLTAKKYREGEFADVNELTEILIKLREYTLLLFL